MITKIFTATNLGLEAQLIEVEMDLSPALPAVVMVGLPDKAVQESKERIRAGLKQSGFEFPLGKLTVNLAPADIIKTGTGLDLPIAVGILQLMGYFPKEIDLQKTLFLGELSLDGQLRSVSGGLTVGLWAAKNGFERLFLPEKNTQEISLVQNLTCFGVQNLRQLVDFFNQKVEIASVERADWQSLLAPAFSHITLEQEEKLLAAFCPENLKKGLAKIV